MKNGTRCLYWYVKAISVVIAVVIVLNISGCQNNRDGYMGFVLLPLEKTGINFSNSLTETHEMNIISYPDFYSGGGVAIGDIDADGLADLFFAGNQKPSALYKNLGYFRFEDITASSGLDKTGRGWCSGVCMADVNADGFLDIYISKSGMEAPEDRANLLFINNHDGTFTERGREFGLDDQGFGVNAVFFDFDKDGDIDVYVANQVSSRLNSTQAAALREIMDPYAGDKLYENLGDSLFVDISAQAGIYSSKVGFAHGAAVGDINDDGWEDLFVSNDFFEYDYLYLNNGDKTFAESIKESTKHISNFSMGNDLADFNNDGLLDLVVLDMVAEDNRRLYANTGGNNEMRFNRALQNGLFYQYMFNMLQLNNGNGTFSEIGMLAGISRTDWSWAPLLADFDNDGWKDLYVTNGIRKDIRNIDWGVNFNNLTRFVNDFNEFDASQWDMLLNTLPSEKVTNYMFKNNRDLTFQKVMEDWGMKETSWSNGVAYADLDNDGDLDLVVNNVDDPAFVYENKATGRNFIRFRFQGSEKNPMGLGTKVRIFHGDNFQYQQHYTSRGYRSSMEPVMHFGLGEDTIVNRINVKWPDGCVQELKDISGNQVLLLDYSKSGDETFELVTDRQIQFYDITDSLSISIRHNDNTIIDYIREPLLPYKLSTLGLAFDVGDINGDSLDDFYLGGGSRKPGQLFVQETDGSFSSVQQDFWMKEVKYDDTGALFFDADGDMDLDLYVVSGGNEAVGDDDVLRDRMYYNDGQGMFTKIDSSLPEVKSSGASVKAADFDGDGDLDLFIGGRMIPGSYPLPADSYLLQNERGIFKDVTGLLAPGFIQLGMVTDALWSDYDGDQDPDLIVVGEWMPVTIFKNEGGEMVKMENEGNGLKYSEGWWWSITGEDMDNDGDEDYVIGNMGLNYKWKATKAAPLELYYGNLDAGEKHNFMIGYHQNGRVFPVVSRDRVIDQNPHLLERVVSNDMFAVSDIEDIYSKEVLQKATNRKIFNLKTSYIENKGDGNFVLRPLDNYAQLSNVNSIVIRDVDQDGSKDVLIAGNLYGMEAETIRNDAGIGMWLKGDGVGGFRSIPYLQSGLYIDGDVRVMKELRTTSGKILIVAKYDDSLQLIKINNSE